jgi:CHASE2 domain-containing sensor protein
MKIWARQKQRLHLPHQICKLSLIRETMNMPGWLSSQLKELGEKRAFYWVQVAGIVILGIWAGDRIAHADSWRGLRRSCYQLLQYANPLKPHPYEIVLVLIEDQEYWREPGLFAHRTPIRRDCLANLVRAIGAQDPAVIALDFNLESPSVEGNPIDEPEYAAETDKLATAIRELPPKCAVVLPKTTRTPSPGEYLENAAVYDGKDFGQTKVYKGYISGPNDFPRVALFTMSTQNGGSLSSFAQAIARAKDPRSTVDNKGPALPTTTFVALKEFPQASALDVLKGEPHALEKLSHNVVIVGAHWHRDGYNHGDLIDLHDSIIGLVPGALLHANYVQAILTTRLYWEWAPVWLRIIEVAAALLVALVFALKTGTVAKALAVGVIILALYVTSIVSLLAFALVFDFSILIVLVIAHAVVAHIIERKTKGLQA